MFIASTPALVIAQCRSGIIGSMPALNARTTEAPRRRYSRDRARAGGLRSSLCHQPRLPPDQRASRRRPRGDPRRIRFRSSCSRSRRTRRSSRRSMLMAGSSSTTSRAIGMRANAPKWASTASSRIAAGGGRPYRLALAVRAGPGNPGMVGRASAAGGLHRDRARDSGGRDARRGFRLYRLAFSREPGGEYAAGVQADGRRGRLEATSSSRRGSPAPAHPSSRRRCSPTASIPRRCARKRARASTFPAAAPTAKRGATSGAPGRESAR